MDLNHRKDCQFALHTAKSGCPTTRFAALRESAGRVDRTGMKAVDSRNLWSLLCWLTAVGVIYFPRAVRLTGGGQYLLLPLRLLRPLSGHPFMTSAKFSGF